MPLSISLSGKLETIRRNAAHFLFSSPNKYRMYDREKKEKKIGRAEIILPANSFPAWPAGRHFQRIIAVASAAEKSSTNRVHTFTVQRLRTRESNFRQANERVSIWLARSFDTSHPNGPPLSREFYRFVMFPRIITNNGVSLTSTRPRSPR